MFYTLTITGKSYKETSQKVIKLMDKLIDDLNLTTLKQNGENLSKVSLSPKHSSSEIDYSIDDEVFCVDGRLNFHLPKGKFYKFA